MKKFTFCFWSIMSVLPIFLFAQDEPPPPPPVPPGQSMWTTLFVVGIALLFFYFILWRPEMKRRKQLETQRNTMKKGDRVTAMGILGKIIKVEEATVVLELYDGAKMEVMKGAITDIVSGDDPVKTARDESIKKK